MNVRCTWALAWCVQDHVAGGLQRADTPLVVFAPTVATVSLALLTSRWQIPRPSGSLIPPPPSDPDPATVIVGSYLSMVMAALHPSAQVR